MKPEEKNNVKNNINILQDWLDDLLDSDTFIIVEGSSDKKALINLGIPKYRIQKLDTELFLLAEKVANIIRDNAKETKVIILTDRDIEGRKIKKKLKTFLANNGVKVDNYFQKTLFQISDISHIEGLDTYFNNLFRKQKLN